MPAWRRLLAQFPDPLVFLLLAAIVVSWSPGSSKGRPTCPSRRSSSWPSSSLNAVLGYVQESRAEQAVAALQAMAAPTASVLRDGEQQRGAPPELVPGDILAGRGGDTISADARLIEVIAAADAEAALTGESSRCPRTGAAGRREPASATSMNMVFSGTAVTFGRGRAVVTATGMATEIGRIAGLLQAAPRRDHPAADGARPRRPDARHRRDRHRRRHERHDPAGRPTCSSVSDVVDVLLLGVSLAVAAVPEGLTAIITVVLVARACSAWPDAT